MNDFNSTESSTTPNTQTAIKLQNLSVLQPNTRLDSPEVSTDPVLLTEQELKDYEIEKTAPASTPVAEPEPVAETVFPSVESTQEPVELIFTPESLPESEEEPVIVIQAKPLPKKEETPIERAQNAINDCTPSIGLSLSSARRGRQVDLQTVAEKTRIPKTIIENIEAGDFNKAPAPVYTRAYIKKLAEFYEVDAQALVDQYNHMLELQRRSKPVKTTTTTTKRQECVSSINLKPMISETKSNSKFIKRISLLITFLLVTWLVVNCTGGKKRKVQKKKASTEVIKTAPVISLKDLTNYAPESELETIILDVPKNKIK